MSEMKVTPSPIDINFRSRFVSADNEVERLKREFVNPQDKTHQKLKKAAQEFESIFFKQVLEQMDKTVERGDFMSGGHAEEMFRSMMFDEIAKNVCTRPGGSGFGLAEQIYKDLAKKLPSDEAPSANNVQGEGH